MLRIDSSGVEWLEFEHLSKQVGLKHAVFLRHGGVSNPPFDTLNTSTASGDCLQSVNSNCQVLASALGVKPPLFLNQVHGAGIVCVKHSQPESLDADAWVTDASGLCLGVRHADCQAAIFFDPVTNTLALAHAGWRGLVQNIYSEVISKLKIEYDCDPKNILVGIGPSLGPAHAEFINYKTEFPKEFWAFCEKDNHFNLWDIAQKQLIDLGIVENHLEIARICTYENRDDYFSYRREKVTGRHATIAAITP